MILLLDAGNSCLKWAVYRSGSWPGAQRASWPPQREDLFARLWADAQPPQSIWVSNVAGTEFEDALRTWATSRWSLEPEFIRSGNQQCGVSNLYFSPEQLGSDRWAALIAARRRYPEGVIVVDCGTAVTVDALSGSGVFEGGAILAGLFLARDSLSKGTVAVQDSTEYSNISALNRSTAEAVSSGSLLGLVGGIERIVDEMNQQLDANLPICLTGGDADQLKPYLQRSFDVVPDLVLQGLAVIAESTR